MKNFISIFLLSFLATHLQAQIFVDGVQLDSTNSGAYLEFSKRGFTSSVFIEVDYGQVKKVSGRHDNLGLTDKNGEAIKFEGMVEALNYFDKNGWELVSTWYQEEFKINKYILHRKKTH
ncbi:MAG: hypothetical protein HY842_15350 [Bacteroidetes bacterium]|nr:hypothetical protein [Bacteroidota bacterium]